MRPTTTTQATHYIDENNARGAERCAPRWRRESRAARWARASHAARASRVPRAQATRRARATRRVQAVRCASSAAAAACSVGVDVDGRLAQLRVALMKVALMSAHESHMKVAELKEELEARNEAKSGNKAWLRRRLHAAIVRGYLQRCRDEMDYS